MKLIIFIVLTITSSFVNSAELRSKGEHEKYMKEMNKMPVNRVCKPHLDILATSVNNKIRTEIFIKKNNDKTKEKLQTKIEAMNALVVINKNLKNIDNAIKQCAKNFRDN